jgi:hypothetical protein
MGIVNADRSSVVVAGKPVDRARLAEVCERFGIAELSVFGSVARDEAGLDSECRPAVCACPWPPPRVLDQPP